MMAEVPRRAGSRYGFAVVGTVEDRSAISATLSADDVAGLTSGLELVVVERRWLAHYPLSLDRSLSIGRARECDIVLDDAAASRRHAVVHVAGGLSIEDLNSRNGTRVGGQSLAPRQRAPLRVGEAVQIGGATLLVQYSAVASCGPASGTVARPVSPEGFIPAGGRMKAALDLIRRVAPTPVTVLILGETGVGKELVAEAIHRASGARSARPLVRINCAAIPDQLLESELFGYERGAFTGASTSKPGLLEAAHGGTVLLDEIGELPLAAQPKLLRALEAREVTRVGALRARPIDVRFLAATNRDLRVEIARGNFREDLYFRLKGVSVAVPPLREHAEDIEALARHFIGAFSQQLDRPAPRLAPSALECLCRHPWPGNVRELRNAVEWAVLHTSKGAIEACHLPPDLCSPDVESAAVGDEPARGRFPATTAPPPSPWTEAQLAERHCIVDALAACNGNQTRAAERLHMPRRTFVAKLAAYAIPRPRSPLR
jgi:two-component system response regulator AtoC